MSQPDAYTYDADIHCPACAEARFGRGADGFIATDSEGEPCTDSEGNPVGVIAPWDWDHTDDRANGEYCGTCHEEIVAPWATEAEIDAMTEGYLAAVAWCGYVLPGEGEHDRHGMSPDDHGAPLAESVRTDARMDCEGFLSDPEVLIALRSHLPWSRDIGQAGPDFWLTREGHGTGFWDRGAGDAGDLLSRAAKAFGVGGCLVINARGEAEFA